MGVKKRKKMHQKRILLTLSDPRAVISEQFRTIRTNIKFSAIDQTIKSIVITSSEAEEGKSTVAANLAVVFAQEGKKTLLIDADLRKPTVQYTFNLMNTTGLTSVLSHQVSFGQAVHKTHLSELDVLTSGPIPPNPSELLSSRAMENLMKEVKEEYDMVIFDSPPVIIVTDAQLLANQCDGSILVVRSNHTDKEKVMKAKELLNSANTRILGAVLNDKKVINNNYYQYYGEK
ncbi:CpsD/CapB family tyrosine-protein kinase [Jeotgalibacillus haloalkalitolerans]|uniref:non-specific protein-tyrosine kinase n=1 Tax=Jeotgalibacillus haloalkalitolerans TaxID=3104292 RepID=A0ABU5KI33_9BACL|nr:CpsD/CapB family tyrosine-protein kinase [Jeotgalibacillus sp. HH7-29]MDZ5710904.1 CpsD/CapB family tyrosine-protein kinase [Jeotgalibacillus sp. HH7-29]